MLPPRKPARSISKQNRLVRSQTHPAIGPTASRSPSRHSARARPTHSSVRPGSVTADVLPSITPTRIPGLSTSAIVATGDPFGTEITRIDFQVGLREIASLRERGVASGKHDVDLARPHALEDGAVVGIHDLFERYVEPFRSFGLTRSRRRTPARDGSFRKDEGLPRYSPTRSLPVGASTLRTSGLAALSCAAARTISPPSRTTASQRVVRIRIAMSVSTCQSETSSSRDRHQPRRTTRLGPQAPSATRATTIHCAGDPRALLYRPAPRRRSASPRAAPRPANAEPQTAAPRARRNRVDPQSTPPARTS